jgi:uncharacterized C2H2 Zn-finger protein
MAHRVPDDETVVAAARSVLREAKSVVSQRELRRLVLLELRRADKTFSLGGERLRRLMAHQDFARVELRARKGSREKILTKCPVCDERLVRQKNQTLFGGEVTLTLRCPRCGYWTGKEKRIPTLYTFHFAGADPGRGGPQEGATRGRPF